MVQAQPRHDGRLLFRVYHGIPGRAGRQPAGRVGGLPVAQDAQRHQLLHRQPGRGRHTGARLLSARHALVQHLCP